MKKHVMVVGLILSCFLSGCGSVTDELLSTYDFNESNYDTSNNSVLSTLPYISEDFVVVSDKENQGGNPSITAKAALCVNTTTNELLYASDVYEKLYPASLTKLMTTLVVLKYAELTDKVTVSYNASHISESGAKLCGLKEGDVLTLEDLLNMLLIYSGNDAAIAIAEHVSGSEKDFCKLMTDEASLLGAVHSNFVNPHGLHNDDQYTTAYDLYLIFNELVKYDTFLQIIGQTSCKVTYVDKNQQEKTKTFSSTNKYLMNEIAEPDGIICIGGKTGTTSKAGYCLILYSKNEAEEYSISLLLKDQSNSDLYRDMNTLLSLTHKN